MKREGRGGRGVKMMAAMLYRKMAHLKASVDKLRQLADL
jgi:hypothetical protein